MLTSIWSGTWTSVVSPPRPSWPRNRNNSTRTTMISSTTASTPPPPRSPPVSTIVVRSTVSRSRSPSLSAMLLSSVLLAKRTNRLRASSPLSLRFGQLAESIAVADVGIEVAALGERAAHRPRLLLGHVEVDVAAAGDELDHELAALGRIIEAADDGRRHSTTTNSGRFALPFAADLPAREAVADFAVVEPPLRLRLGKAARDCRRHVRIDIAPAAGEQQVELPPLGQIPGAANDAARRANGAPRGHAAATKPDSHGFTACDEWNQA